MKKFGAVALLLALTAGFIYWQHQKSQTPVVISRASKSSPAQVSPPPFNKSRYSTDQADSLWAVVNKGRSLPGSYVPADLVAPNVPLRLSPSASEMHLRSAAAQALEQMTAAAKSDGVSLMLASGYRSYAEQEAVYGNEVKTFGQAQADRESARPGHSEHQTGLAADLEPADRSCEVTDCFADTPAGKWVAANAYKFGFILRYPQTKESLTGYRYEPWHVRYVGQELAAELNRSDQTLEQSFGLPSYSDYPTASFELKS